jgi:hypothetical protein
MLGRKTADKYLIQPTRKAANIALLALAVAISALLVVLVKLA